MTSALVSSSINSELLSTIKEKNFKAMQCAYIADIIQLYWGNAIISDVIVKSERSKVHELVCIVESYVTLIFLLNSFLL